MCSRCWQAHPDRPFVQADNLAARLDGPPPWLADFVAHLAARHCVGRTCTMITTLGRLLSDGRSTHPHALLERARRPGRSMGPLARALQDFFVERALAVPTDQAQRLAADRRRRRVEAAPEPLRGAVADYEDSMLRSRDRARRAGTRPRTDHTIESALATMADFARFLTDDRSKHDWALADVHDIEAFLTRSPNNRKRHLSVLRQFFRSARAHRIVLTDPTRGLSVREPRGFHGATISRHEQRALFRRWTSEPHPHPHEALLGILALLHGVSSQEVRDLRLDDIDSTAHTIHLGRRPYPVPLDPASWAVLQRCLDHRETLRTANPHVMVTRGTRAGTQPASTAYLSHRLAGCGVPPRTIRSTRLIDLVNTLDPKLVSAAFGMTPQSTIRYLADHVDPDRLPPTHPEP